MKQGFAETYKSLSLARLLEITDHPGQYAPEALEAAQEELASRQASAEQLDEARQNSGRRQEILEKNRSPFLKLFDWVYQHTISRAFPADITTAEKLVRLICIILVVMAIPDFYYLILSIGFMVNAMLSGEGLYALRASLNIAVPVIIAFLLWTRKTAGWMLLCICLFSYVFPVIMGWLLFAGFGVGDLLGFRLYPGLWTVCYTTAYSAVLYFMNRKEVRGLYNIRNVEQVIAAAIVLLLLVFKQVI